MKTKMPGVVTDPWRTQVTPKTTSKPAPPDPSHPPPAPPQDTDSYDQRFATIELAGYGGITVEGTSDIPVAAVRILRFCCQEKSRIEDLFAEFGVVITKTAQNSFAPQNFYIQASDGWLLAVPGAKTRDQGALQLIQAMMHLNTLPEFRDKLHKAKIRPYKM
jgi:hypothetical protein